MKVLRVKGNMITATLLLWALLVHKNAAQPWPPVYSIQDENVESRYPRYSDLDPEDDIKKLFFRRVRTDEDVQNTETPSSYFVDIPQPGGFKIDQEKNNRVRRDTNDTKKADSTFEIVGQIQADIEKHLGRPLDIAVLDTEDPSEPENNTGSEIKSQTKVSAEPKKETGIVGINDFIRFRRDAQPEPQLSGKNSNTKNVNVEQRSESINEQIGELTDLSSFSVSDTPKREEQEKTGRMLMQEENIVPEGSREPRGATKEQWVKQPYPVHALSVDDNNYDDTVPSPSDVRAPRVHFVTQRRLETAPPQGNYGNYEREGRSRDLSRDSVREPPRAASRNPPPRKPEREYFPEQPLKHYDPYPPRPFIPYRDDPYYRYEESRYEPQYGPAEHDRYRPEFTSRQRRIIYYATLPEVVRTPPNVNLRDRYSYRDRYDDRYVTSPSLSVAEGNSYRFRKPYPFTKSRYDHEMERTKAPYPLKVSTDVNVRETKKNPERRIYSEPDRRYAYKAPSYQSEESFDHRT